MRGTWVGVVMAVSILSSGCAPVHGGGFGGGTATAYQRGPVYGLQGKDYHTLASPVALRPSPASPVGFARGPVWLGPGDSPLAGAGILGIGVRGLPGADARRLGLGGYAKNWAELGLGRSVTDMNHDPGSLFGYLQFGIFPTRGSRPMLWY